MIGICYSEYNRYINTYLKNCNWLFIVLHGIFMSSFSKIWHQVKIFQRKNSILFWSFWGATGICTSYILTLHVTEWFSGADAWFNLLFQLAVGFIINFMFYITQVYIPRYKQNMEVNRCISDRIFTIVQHMGSIFEELGKIYMNGYDKNSVTDKYLLDLLKKINASDMIQVLNPEKYRLGQDNSAAYFTVKEWIISRVRTIEMLSDKIFQYYEQYLTTELIETLESIQKSPMHRIMARQLLLISDCEPCKEIPKDIFKEIPKDIFMKPYYEQMKKLENISSQYVSGEL